MKKTKYLAGMLLIFCGIVPSFAQLAIEAQIRPRFEMRDGYQKLASIGSVPAVFISQRTRVSFVYSSEKLRLRITPQDVRVWGDEQLTISTGVLGDDASLDLFEGYAEIRLGKSGWISVGRQPIFYDGARIFSDRNWNQNGLSYDALILKLNPREWTLHLGTSWNSTGENNSDNLYPSARLKSINYFRMSRSFADVLKLSFFHHAAGRTMTNTVNTLKFRQTSGIYMDMTFKAIGLFSNIYYQFGKNVSGLPVSALLFDAEINYTIGKLRSGAGCSYLSGNKKTGSLMTSDHLFDIYYGSRVRYFGGISYFRDMETDTKQGGLASCDLYWEVKVNERLSFRNTSRYLRLAQANPETPVDRNLGFGNDLTFKFQFSEWGMLEGGHYFFLPTQSLKMIQNVPQARYSQFIFLQLTLLPTLFGVSQ